MKATTQNLQLTLFSAPRLWRAVRAIAAAYTASNSQKALSVPYIITCAATLEAVLNDELTGYIIETWPDDYSDIERAYLSMSFRGKLEAVPILLTREKYQLNRNDDYVKRLYALIGVRNSLVHPKPSRHEVGAVPHPTFGANALIPGPEYDDLADDFTFGAKQQYTPEQYHEALERFDRWFLRRRHGDLSKVRLLKVRNPTNNRGRSPA